MPETPNPADVYAGSKLRLQRQLRNMSQTALADALGITFQQVQKYEKGKNRISASRLQTICKILGVQISFFFEDGDNQPTGATNGEPENSSIAPFLRSKDSVALNKHFIAIKDAGKRRAVLELVKALAEAEQNGKSELVTEAAEIELA